MFHLFLSTPIMVYAFAMYVSFRVGLLDQNYVACMILND